ncbi:MAG: hypothetical protein AB7R90_14850 [Reyranellaceae bacterium]
MTQPSRPISDTVFPYRREDGHVLIEIALDSVRQLFNSLDPAPFHSKDLDAEAEAFIVGAVRELPGDAPLKLVIWLPADEAASEPAHNLPQIVQNYFAHGERMAQRELRLELREARLILLAGLVFLGLCLGARQALLSLQDSGVVEWLAEGLLIVGWVGMWRPLEAVLYDWWPARRRRRILARLARTPVEVRAGASPTATTPGGAGKF